MFICTEIGCFLTKKLDVCFARKMDVYLHRNLIMVVKKLDVCFARQVDVYLHRNLMFVCKKV